MHQVDSDRDEPGAPRPLAALHELCLSRPLTLLRVAIAFRVFAPPTDAMALVRGALRFNAMAVRSVTTVRGLATWAWSAHKASVAVAYGD